MNNKPTQYPSSHIIKVLFAVAICFVAGYYRIVAIETTEFTPPILRADFQEYYLSAYNLMHEGVYSRSPGRLMNPPTQITPDAYRPPGLPLVIATFMHLWPDHKTIMKRVQSVNVALGIAAALATYIAAASIFPLTVSVIAGLLVAASPHLIAVSVYVLTEPAAVFLVALLLFVAALGCPKKSPLH